MSKVTQYSRISHHTLAGSASATFSVPASEDFTDGSWSIYDLALSEIGINEDSKKAYIRINDEVKEFEFIGGTAGDDLQTTLSIGNTTGANDIIIGVDQSIRTTDTGFILFGDSGAGDLNTIIINNGGDGVTIPANGFGFSGTDPYFNAQVVDIGGVTDTISIDPQGLVNGTGILSEDPTYNYLSQLNITPTQVVLSSTDGTYSSVIDITETYANISHTDGTDSSIIDMSQSQLILSNTDTTNTITDTISIDPQGLGTGTGIRSENTTTGIYSQIYQNPTSAYIYADAGNSGTILYVDENRAGISFDAITDTSNDFTTIEITDGGRLISFVNNPTGGNAGIFILGDGIDLASSVNLNISGVTSTITAVDKIRLDTNAVRKCFGGDIITTTTNAVTTLFTYVPSGSVSSKAIYFKAYVTGVDSTLTDVYGAELFGVFKNDGGTITQVSTTDKSEKTLFSTATSDIDTDGTNIRVRVTGETGIIINWEVRVEYND